MSTVDKRVNWTLSTRCASVIFVGLLAFQLIVPLVALGAPKPARFGWQMYARAGHAPSDYSLLLPDGSQRDIDVWSHIGYGRPDVRFDDYLPGYLCEQFPEAVALIIRAPASPRGREQQCP